MVKGPLGYVDFDKVRVMKGYTDAVNTTVEAVSFFVGSIARNVFKEATSNIISNFRR